MAFVWVQQWFALPIFYEEPMGDLPPGSRSQALENAATGFAPEGNQHPHASTSLPYKTTDNTVPFYSQLSPIPPSQLRSDYRSPPPPSSQYPSQDHVTPSLNMGSLAGALPEYSSIDEAPVNSQGSQSIPQSLLSTSTSATIYQLGQNLQIPAHASGNFPNPPSYGNGYSAGPYQQQTFSQGQHTGYPPYAANQARMPGGNSVQTAYQNYPQPSQYMYYSTPYSPQGQYNSGYPAQNPAMYDRRSTVAGLTSPHIMDYQHLDGGFGNARLGPGGLQSDHAAIGPTYGAHFARLPGMLQPGPVNSIPRGPPRKPKQSGHALWVGNLPPGTTVIALKDHFSREASKDIESLFLISKSNCAFVNYRSEESCTAAMHRFHDSRFNGVRLVCRLRRSSAPASGVPTGPSAIVGSQQTNPSPPKTPQPHSEAIDGVQDSVFKSLPQNAADEPASGASTTSNKYFIVKSLTLQDLELSVRNGIWATQSHNEDVLNKAFRSTENVYLIFSANKSGEYFGYARMTSPILEDGSRFVGSTPKQDNIMDVSDVPKSIPTVATEWAPRGKIIDDSARGTIFWEAELPETELEQEPLEKDDGQVDGDNSVTAQSWGKPFKIEWVSTARLPFYRTRGLRNPWNANREVKIARDGTELEPSVGERLVQMFHQVGPANVGAPMMPAHAQLARPGVHQTHPF
ncbi:YT521-B-like domain-containing protein [Phaeosphaeriaceae sp. PMI808]|nr:YT521-B-like domain-containing protein [Phaeosphaeriaceae sp. PMI808]